MRPDGSADIDGPVLVRDANEQFNLEIDEDTYTTVGGYVLGGSAAARAWETQSRSEAVRCAWKRSMRCGWRRCGCPPPPTDPRRRAPSRPGDGGSPRYSARSSRSAFAMTMIDAPVSATTAIHSVATPATAATTNVAFITREIATLALMFRTVARLKRSA